LDGGGLLFSDMAGLGGMSRLMSLGEDAGQFRRDQASARTGVSTVTGRVER